HAVYQWGVEADQARGVGGGVNWVVVTGDQREWGHIRWRGDNGAIHEGTWGGLNLVLRLAAAPGWCRNRNGGAGSAATDGKALHLRRHNFLSCGIPQLKFHGDNASGVGFRDGCTAGGDVNATTLALFTLCEFVKRNTHVDDVVEVDCVEQAFNDREVGAGWFAVFFGQTTGAQRGVDCWPAGANQRIWGACVGGAQGSAGDRGVCGQQGRRQGKGVFHQAVRVFFGDRAFNDLWQLGDLIAGLRDRTDTSNACEQVEDCLWQTRVINNRGGTGCYGFRQCNRDINVLDVERALLLRQVIPVGVRVDANSKAFAVIDDVKGFFWQLIRRVGNEMTVPHDGWCIAQELFCIFGRGQAGLELNWCHTGIVKRCGGGVFEATEQVCDGLILLGDTSNRNRSWNNAYAVCVVAWVLGLPQGVLGKPFLQVTVNSGGPRHWLDVLADKGREPCLIAGVDLGGLRVRVGSEQLGYCLWCVLGVVECGE